MSVSDKFSTFCSNLRMSDSTVSSVSSRAKSITKRINSDFWSSSSEYLHSLFVGSYGRGTDIHISDIDMIIELPYSYYTAYSNHLFNGQSALLQLVKNSLKLTYSLTEMRGDGQVVVIQFYDGMRFEVVPAFKNTDGDYIYPDTNNGGSWKITKPRKEIDSINTWNFILNKNLKRLCRMARAWKEQWNVPISGMLIDTLAKNFLENYEYRDKSYLYYDYMTRDFLFYLSNQNQYQNYWLALGSSSYVYRTGIFEHKAKRCYNLAVEAISSEFCGHTYTANLKWREIYGTKFPA
ncbi:SMODS domain-containing nucleotidyltransferase [Providencia hangzhouensis]|uniref:SMODS domain-containing nucleotidyltransferase n=1 Tax=Providencia hangzhouensis TaxID=3031799 RepID=UPI003F4B27F6